MIRALIKEDLRGSNGTHSKRRLTTSGFVDRAVKVHGNKYDYSKVVYVNNRVKVTMILTSNGDFFQVPNSHLHGSGCPECGLLKNTRNRSGTTKSFIDRAIKVHGNKYDYSKVLYTNAHNKVVITCSIHGDFRVDPNNFLKGHGCRKCYFKSKECNNFIERFKRVHGNTYDYSKVKYKNNNTKICIICDKHEEFWQLPRIHFNGHGCPICNSSKGEQLIRDWLKNNSISWIQEYTFPDLRGLKNKPLRFDFYLPDINTLIEYDGQQHYMPVQFFGMSEKLAINSYKRTVKCDLMKNKYTEENDINLIRINYKQINSINRILDKKILVNE